MLPCTNGLFIFCVHVYVCVDTTDNCVPMDEAMFRSTPYQRVYQYLRRHIEHVSLDRFSYQTGYVTSEL